MKTIVLLFAAIFISHSQAGRFDSAIEVANNNPSYYTTSLTTAQITEFKESYMFIIKVAFGQQTLPANQRDYSGVTPEHLINAHFELVQGVYLSGLSKNQFIDQWSSEYRALFGLTPVPQAQSGLSEKEWWLSKHTVVLNSFISRIQASNPECANEGQVVGNKKCCLGHIKIPVLNEAIAGRSCIEKDNACSSNNDCCSLSCLKSDVNSPGKCVAQTACTKIRAVGEACNLDNQVCSNSTCINMDISLLIGNQSCKSKDSGCTVNGDCCSGSCTNNRCQEVLKCTNCKGSGARLSQGDICCPGYIKLNSKCVVPIPKYIPTVKLYKKNIFQKLFSLLIPSAYAATGEETEITEAQRDLIEEKEKECNSNNSNTGSRGYQECIAEVSRLRDSYSKDTTTDLTRAQTDQVTAKREACTSAHQTNSEGHKACMAEADAIEKLLLQENIAAGETCKVHGVATEKYKECMIDKGAMGLSLSKEEYLDKYNIPGVTAKTYSDVKTCSFNSLNDSWRDASNKEKNAEIFLRGFEFVFSHKGTEDYWQDENKGNIFKRANGVAVKFRKNRTDMLIAMKEIDRVMACKCIAIFGPANFNSQKQNFFNSSCEVEKEELRSSLGEDLADIDEKKEGVGESKIDGTSISTLDSGVSEVDKANAATEEIDKGAIGISHEKLLVEWLNLRAEAQMERFMDNSDLEEDLTQLSEFISNVNFNEVFKDRVQSNAFMASSPEGHSEILYKWGYTYPAGGFFGGLFFGSQNRTSGLTSNLNLPNGMKAAWKYDQDDDIDSKPEIVDVKTLNKKCIKRVLGICIKYMDGFTRYYIGPRFNNESTVDETKCEIKGRASACFKSGYKVVFNEETSYIVDPTLPLFVSNSEVQINKMHGYDKTYVKMLNEASVSGILYLKTLKPSGGRRRGYLMTRSSFANNDHLKAAVDLGHFLPAGISGGLNEVDFEEDKKNLIVKAAKKYSLCKSLVDCGASELEDDKLIGYGYLFESPSEALEFSKYAYEIHYKWSHLTKSDYMGYPLIGMDQYFQMVAYNMKLVGSLSASRSMQYADAYQLYKADFEQRVKEYNSLGQGVAGTLSRNIKYSGAFYNLFGKLNFDGETNLEVFDASMTNASTSTKFNAAEVAALNAGKSTALRRNKELKAKKEFDSAAANTNEVSKNALKENAKMYLKASTPLASFGMKKFGGKAGMKNLAAAISDLNKNVLDWGAKGTGGGGSGANFKSNFKMPKGFSYKPSRGGSTKSAPAVNYQDHKMSGGQINSLLTNLKKDKNLSRKDSDNLFTIVSKAYKRNYSRVLQRSLSSTKFDRKLLLRKVEKIQDSDKQKLRSLLGE